MLNYIWAAMIVVGILFGAVNGNMKEITEAALDSAGEAVSLCIATAAIMAFWVGLMEVAQSSGLIARLTDMLSPFISFMFPRLPKEHRAKGFISMNIIANVLGLGWAATPAGLKAMEELAKLEEERGTAGYLADGIATNGGAEKAGGRAKGRVMDGIALEGDSAGKEQGKRERYL